MNELTTQRQEQAVLLHNRILANGRLAAEALVGMCKDLKQMRDDGLYSELGYESFENYAEQACGIKQRQAYSYIAAYERLGNEFIEQNAELGITKLELLSQVPSYEREEFLEEINIDDVSTRELKEEIQKWKSQTEQLTFENQTLKNEAKESEKDLSFAQAKLDEARAELESIKSQPKEVAVEIDQGAIDKAVQQAKDQSAEQIKKLKQQIKDEKKKTASAKESALEEANEKIEKLIAAGKEKDEKLQEALKAAKVAGADEDIIKIRLLFNDLQSTAIDIHNTLVSIANKDGEKADKLENKILTTIQSIFTGA